MKNSLLIKLFLILPLIIFTDYIIMAAIGCTSCLFGLSDEFYCGPFCIAGKILIALSAIGFLYILRSELESVFRKFRNIFHRHAGANPE